MSDGDGPSGELPSELKSALKKLEALFAGALGDAKLESCCAAWSSIRVAKTKEKKFEILHDRARQWREGSVDAVRAWFPRFVELAEAYDESLHGGALRWATDRVWELVEKQCGISRRKSNKLHGVEPIGRTMVFWFAVACEGDSDVNGPPPRPWKAPRWFARDGGEADSLLREHTHHFWLRLNQVIHDEADSAKVQTTSRRRGVAGVPRSLYEPELLLRIINKKKRQLAEIEGDLQRLPLDHPTRSRWLERMLHLQQGIPALEAEYARRTGDSQRPYNERQVTTKTVSVRAPNASPRADLTQDKREVVIKKIRNPQTYTILSTLDAALYFEVQPRTIHRWKAENKLRSGGRRGSVTIRSIRQWEKQRSRKRPTS